MAMRNIFNDQITASCICLYKILSFDSSMVRIDISVAKRIIEDRIVQTIGESEVIPIIEELSKL